MAAATRAVQAVEVWVWGAEDNGTKIYNNSVTLKETLEQIVKADDLKDLEIKELIITAYNFSAYNTTDSWVTFTADTNWSTKLGKSSSSSYSDEKSGWSWSVTDSETIAKFKEGGIYVAGTADSTATVTVSYK
ncbi:MAG: hypothetical protein ACI4LX_05460 [Treponema sp.]